jgi:hypothetical protein
MLVVPVIVEKPEKVNLIFEEATANHHVLTAPEPVDPDDMKTNGPAPVWVVLTLPLIVQLCVG